MVLLWICRYSDQENVAIINENLIFRSEDTVNKTNTQLSTTFYIPNRKMQYSHLGYHIPPSRHRIPSWKKIRQTNYNYVISTESKLGIYDVREQRETHWKYNEGVGNRVVLLSFLKDYGTRGYAQKPPALWKSERIHYISHTEWESDLWWWSLWENFSFFLAIDHLMGFISSWVTSASTESATETRRRQQMSSMTLHIVSLR